jgi:hypothetical protein
MRAHYHLQAYFNFQISSDVKILLLGRHVIYGYYRSHFYSAGDFLQLNKYDDRDNLIFRMDRNVFHNQYTKKQKRWRDNLQRNKKIKCTPFFDKKDERWRVRNMDASHMYVSTLLYFSAKLGYIER